MRLPITHLFVKAGVSCTTAALLFTLATSAEAHGKTVNLDDNVLCLSSSLAAPSFNQSLGLLSDVSLILKLNGQSYTLFDTAHPNDDLIDLRIEPYRSSTSFSGAEISAWDQSKGYLDLVCTVPEGKTASGEGPATNYLFNTPYCDSSRCLQLDYTCNIGSSATPEPAAKYLAAIAAGLMACLLWRRKSPSGPGAVEAQAVA